MSFPTTPVARLTDHSGPVHAVTFSAGTGQYVLTGSQDRKVRLFNPSATAPRRALIQTYAAHGHEVLDLAVAGDNARFASVGGDKAVFLWDVTTAQTLRRWIGHTQRVDAVAFGADDGVVVSGSFDRSVMVWDARARGDKAVLTLTEAGDGVSCVAVRGREIYAGSVDGRVRVYDVASGLLDVDVLGASVTSVAPSAAAGADGGEGAESYLVSTLDSRLRVMDRVTGRCLRTCRAEGFRNDTYRLRSAWASAEECVLSGSEDGRVFVWDVLSGKLRASVWHSGGEKREEGGTGGKEDVVSAVAWNQLRRQWASAGGDGTVIVWGLGE